MSHPLPTRGTWRWFLQPVRCEEFVEAMWLHCTPAEIHERLAERFGPDSIRLAIRRAYRRRRRKSA